MNKLQKTMLLLSITPMAIFSAPSAQINCGKTVINIQSTASDVLKACGQPSATSTYTKQSGKVVSTSMIYKDIPFIYTFKYLGSDPSAQLDSIEYVTFPSPNS